jgi:hypothetical protein
MPITKQRPFMDGTMGKPILPVKICGTKSPTGECDGAMDAVRSQGTCSDNPARAAARESWNDPEATAAAEKFS